jgi:hypothetical protein
MFYQCTDCERVVTDTPITSTFRQAMAGQVDRNATIAASQPPDVP